MVALPLALRGQRCSCIGTGVCEQCPEERVLFCLLCSYMPLKRYDLRPSVFPICRVGDENDAASKARTPTPPAASILSIHIAKQKEEGEGQNAPEV